MKVASSDGSRVLKDPAVMAGSEIAGYPSVSIGALARVGDRLARELW